MPLSKARDRERKRQSRLDKRVVDDSVQPNDGASVQYSAPHVWVDADGNEVFEDEN